MKHNDLLLLSRFRHVWLCATPKMAAHQAPPSLGFSRQEHWSGLPFLSPMHESQKWKWNHFSRVQLCATPQTAAHQAPPSLGSSRQEYWSGVPLPSLLRSSTTNKFRHKTQTHDLHDRWYSPLGKVYKTSDKFCKIAWSKPCKNAVDTTHKHFPIICCSPCSSNSHISVLITGRRTYSI